MTDATFVATEAAIYGPILTFLLTSYLYERRHGREMTKLREKYDAKPQIGSPAGQYGGWAEAYEAGRKEVAAERRLRDMESRLKTIEARLPPEASG